MKFTKTPPTDNLRTGWQLVQFQDLVCKILNNTTEPQNLTRTQLDVLNTLWANNNIHSSVADKTAELVVMKIERHIRATKLHFEDPAYKKLGIPSAEKDVRRFISELTKSREAKVNSKWQEIYKRRNLSQKVHDLFAAHHTSPPMGRVQLKLNWIEVK